MSETKLNDRNAAIQAMLTDGENLMNFYRFAAQNPHLPLRVACQIVIARPNAQVCYAFEEWNAMGRRINNGSAGIPFIDMDGQRRFVFDSNDTHGNGRYRRLVYPMKRLIKGFDALNGTTYEKELSGDYHKVKGGVAIYLYRNDYFTDDDERNRRLLEGVSYYLYCKTGFPKANGVTMSGLPYELQENAGFFLYVKEVAEQLQREVEQAYVDDLNKVEVVNDIEEDAISDEPIVKPTRNIVEVHSAARSNYKGYVVLCKHLDTSRPDSPEEIYLGKSENYDNAGNYDNTDNSLVLVSKNGKMFSFLRDTGWTLSQQEMLDRKLFTEEDYKEFNDLQNGLLKDFEKTGEIRFKDEPFRYPDWNKQEAKPQHPMNPIYTKYMELQSQYPNAVVVYRLGDFYEVFGENAVTVGNELELTITSREFGLEQRVPMIGYPYHVSDKYTEKILEKHSVVVVEPDEEPKYIMSHEEALREKPDPFASLISIDDEELPFDTDEQEEDERDEYFDDEEESEEKPEQEEIVVQPQKKEKSIRERKRKPEAQLSFFDFMDGNEPQPDPREELIKKVLKRGSQTADGKFRIVEEYQKDPSTKGFAISLKDEYGTGGFGGVDGVDEWHDSKGIRAKFEDKENPENNTDFNLKWEEVAVRIADLIDDGMYFTPEQKEEFAKYQAERNGSIDSRIKAIAAHTFDHLWDRQEDRYFRIHGTDYHTDFKFLNDHALEILEEIKRNPLVEDAYIKTQQYSGADFYVYGQQLKSRRELQWEKEWQQSVDERNALKEKGKYGTDEERVKALAAYMIKEGTAETTEGNWVFYYDEFEDNADFVKEHADEIEDELYKNEAVADVIINNESIDIDYYLAYCDQIELEEEEQATDDTETPVVENTDLNEIGFDQSELGGAKARFQANVEAIKLLDKLYKEDRLPTASEKLVLAKYVGWGGLAKAFDEHDDNWKKEYAELKSVLSPEEYDKARASVLNAHYTSKEVIQGIYKALSEMGVKGNNRILEPAMGTGNFFGFMPKEIADGARLYGVELDSITGKLAQKLYPNANIQVKGFEQTSFSNNRFDLVVGNVPFGAYTVYDSDYARQNFYIHDYFLAKSIDKLKPNGIMAVITSSGTMDKQNPSVRKYLAERAELLGAIRLPNTTFQQTAGTQVVADILFFRKREQQAYVTPDNTEWLTTGKTADGYEINNYFVSHPEMVLGTFSLEHGMYGALDVTVKPDGRTITEALDQAIEHLPKDVYINPAYSDEQNEEIAVDYNVKPLCYKAENGRLFLRVGDAMVEQEIPKSPKDAYERISAMIALRNEIRYVLDIQNEGCSDEKLQHEQRTLNANYDAFVKKYGYLNSQTNTRLFRDDADSALLFACEDVSEDKAKITKADIFSKRTIRPYVVVSSTDDCFEALQISRNERGCVDISYIEELTGKGYDTVLKELDTAVFRNPSATNPEDKYSGFETAEEYLSGNVVQKLHTAQRYASDNKEFERNVKALEAVQLEPIPASEIGVRIGASWIDKDYYRQFLYELLDLPYYYQDAVEIYYNSFDSSWRVDKKGYLNYYSMENANQVYGTSRANAYRLFEDCLNLRATTIYDTVENSDGTKKRVLNQAETIAAREKQNKIKDAFVEWIFNDPDRREQLERQYNATFNQVRLPTYDGSYLRFPGMNPAIELKPHQKNAIHRIVSTGDNTLLHHVVGSGKTFTMMATAMKLRQYGLAKKIMIAVPNHLVEQWAAEGRKLYPNAKILVATKDDLSKEKRQRFVSKVAMGDWDAIIIAQSSFAKIPISPERQIAKIQEEIERIEQTIEATWADKGMPRGAVKNLEKIKKNREAQLKKLLDDDKKDSVLIFENLGVDYLFVDEAHYYKNKFLFTKMNNVAGISTSASQRASDLELKCEYINELHGGDKGVVFATGTPISNSMTEMYTMQSYLQRERLADVGINFFDNWAANFGETVTSLEMAPSGQGYKARTRFAKFTNLPELLTMYRRFADVQTQDMVKLDVPDVDRKVITLKPSDTVLELADEIAKRAEKISNGGVPPEEDNMLKVTSDGKKLALDPRCFERMSTDEEGSKINEAATRIFEIWQDTTATRGTQIVFCDLSTPKKAFEDYEYGKDFDVYNDLKYKLVQMGIPQEEIAFIHDANSDKAKQTLFDKVNSGAVRVLIGSTEKCGAGTNVQERLVALHHLDTPYRPSDMQQREGRIIRQGNTNKEVQIYTYVTERTFDSYSYQILENKQRFISQIDRGDLTVREAEDIDETTLSYAEIKAITAANPKIKRKMEVDTEIARLRVLEGQYKKNLFALQDKIRKSYPEAIRQQTLYLERLRADIATVKANYNPDVFTINVEGKTYTDKKEGGQALMDALMHNRNETVVAEYGGLKIALEPMVMLIGERSISLSGAGKYTMEIGQSASGLITRLDNFLTAFPEKEGKAENKLEQLKHELSVAEEQVGKPFEHREHLAELVKEQAELNAELDLNRREEVVIDDEKDDTVVATPDTDDNFMGLPEEKFVHRERKKPRKAANDSIAKAYDTVKNADPTAYVFIRNGSNYEIYGEQAKELAEKYKLTTITDTISGEKTTVLSVDYDVLDRVVRSVVDSGKTAKIIEEIPQKEESFIDNEDKIATMKVDVMPDYTVDQSEMHDSGYTWDGMLPLRSRMARLLFDMGLPVKQLHYEDTETEVETADDIDEHTGLFGIEKPDWQEFIESDKGKAYLSARYVFCEATSQVVNEEMSYFDARFTDGLSDNNFKEKARLKRYLEQFGLSESDEMKRYVAPLLDDFTKRFYSFPLEEYGWDIVNVTSALAKSLTDDDMREEASQIVEERRLHGFIDNGLEEIEWLKGRQFNKDEIDDIVADLKPYFEGSEYDGGFHGREYDEYYDEFAEESIVPYLESKAFDIDKELEKEIDKMTVEETRDFLGVEDDKRYDYLLDGIDFDEPKEVKTYFAYLRQWFSVHGLENDQYPFTINEFINDAMQNVKTMNYFIDLADTEPVDNYESAKDFIEDCNSMDAINELLYACDITDIHLTYEYGMVVARDSDNNVWRGRELYDFLLHEVVELDEDGKLLDGYGIDQGLVDEVVRYSERAARKEETIDYKKMVIDRVTEEFDKFRDDMLSQPALNVFHSNYEIHIKTELYEVITDGDGYLDEEDYKGLAREQGNILGSLYSDFISNEYASVNTFGETAEFIKEFVKYYAPEKMKYLGKDTENTGYYWQKEGHLSRDRLSEITEKADDYVIAADALALSQEQLERGHIFFLKVGRDITRKELNDGEHAISNMQKAVYRIQKKKADEYREGMRKNVDCKRAIEKGITENFDGMILKTGFEDDIIREFGLERMEYVLANTVQEKDFDGRFSQANKEWAKQTEITEKQEHRYQFVVESHPAVLDGFVNLIREKRLQNKEENTLPQNENNAQNQTEWVNVLTAQDARIKEYDKSTLMRMPTSGEYAGYTYFIFNDRIKRATQITDMQSDSRELALSLRFKEDDVVLIKNLDKDDEVELTVNEFIEQVGGKTNKDYIREREDDQKKWTNINVPAEAMLGSYEKSSLFVLPNKSDIQGSFYVPNGFVNEDTETDDERFRISVPDDFTFTVKNRETEEKVTLSAYQVFQRMNNTQPIDYERQPQAESQSAAPPESDNGWRYVSVDKSAVIAKYDDSTLFRMPKGEYEQYCYYIPNSLLRENEEKGTIRVGIPQTFNVNLMNRNAEKEEERKIEMDADTYVEQVKGKTAQDYEQYQKPSDSRKEAFSIMEKQLREKVPEEMLKRPNWVVVRTKENPDSGRLDKYLINPHTGKFAESDNPETWGTFDEAAKFANENGGVTLAYALDGKDGICCIDLDQCYDEHGTASALVEQVKQRTQGTYREISLSGKGCHFFGKTKGMDVRAFSKDRSSEFYQDTHFIAMTGNTMGGKELMDFDQMPIKEFLATHHNKRSVLTGAGKGVEGLSVMSDRDVVEKAMSSKGGDTFKALYQGQDLQNNHSNSDMSLMNRLAFWCNGDCEQMLRIFATSGLYRGGKSPSYYEHTAIKAIRDTTNRFVPKTQAPVNNKPIGNGSGKGGK